MTELAKRAAYAAPLGLLFVLVAREPTAGAVGYWYARWLRQLRVSRHRASTSDRRSADRLSEVVVALAQLRPGLTLAAAKQLVGTRVS